MTPSGCTDAKVVRYGKVCLVGLACLAVAALASACGATGEYSLGALTPTVVPMETGTSTATAPTPIATERHRPKPWAPTSEGAASEQTVVGTPVVTAEPTAVEQAVAPTVIPEPTIDQDVVVPTATAEPTREGSSAKENIAITAQEVVNSFPEEIVFRLSAHSEATIHTVTLRYAILPDGVWAYGQPEFIPSERVQVDFHLKGNDPPRTYVAPGTRIDYFCEIEDAAGHKLSTEPGTFIYEDTRLNWQTVSEGNVSIYWYGGSRASAESLLAAGRDTLDKMSALLGVTVDYPVKVWIYDSYQDMLPALVRRSETLEQQVVVAGELVSSDTVLMQGEGANDVLRHELAHIVTHVAGEGPYGGIPTWLDEGTAMYAQSEPGEGYTYPLEKAVERHSLLSVRSMTVFPVDPSNVALFYGQAWSLVKFLVETYGPQKFAQLFATFKEGSTVDEALLKVYGFNADGLENEWRASLGLPANESRGSG